jgi:transposase-like protein
MGLWRRPCKASLAGFDDKILALYAKGMSTRDIQESVKTLHGVELSPPLISGLLYWLLKSVSMIVSN